MFGRWKIIEGDGVVVSEVYVSHCFLSRGMEDLVQVQNIVIVVLVSADQVYINQVWESKCQFYKVVSLSMFLLYFVARNM